MTKSEDDPRLAFVYAEAVRGLTQQQTLVEGINARAGSLIFATAFTNSLLGNRALSDGLGAFEWLAIATLFAIGGLVVFMVWPYAQYKFRFSPEMLLGQYVEGDTPMSLSAMHRALALRIEADMSDNWAIFQRLRTMLQIALILLLLNIAAWMFAIAWA
ncbi:MAG: hypothetical protein WBA73_02745 [Devosia sp.]|jgi:hypothetical protein